MSNTVEHFVGNIQRPYHVGHAFIYIMYSRVHFMYIFGSFAGHSQLSMSDIVEHFGASIRRPCHVGHAFIYIHLCTFHVPLQAAPSSA